MIITLTLNPGLDQTYSLSESDLGQVDVHRATASTMEASGKGVNISRALHLNSTETLAVYPVGGPTGRHLSELLDIEGVPRRDVPAQSTTRVNTTMALSTGTTVKVNGPGGALTHDELNSLTREVTSALQESVGGEDVCLAICGSLPPGADSAQLAEFVSLAHRHGATCAVDASGEALAAAVSAGADLIAPNRLELGEVYPQVADTESISELAVVAAQIARDTGVSLLISLGADGALYTDGQSALHGTGTKIAAVNTAGAGDALLAGWLAGPASPHARL
ncbi:MAG: PfkB family carbohydrate kinase, partial [Ornithinimicrobium sp.]